MLVIGSGDPGLAQPAVAEKVNPPKVCHKTVQVGDLDIFYREAGPNDAPAVLLRHGFPTNSRMFRYRSGVPRLLVWNE